MIVFAFKRTKKRTQSSFHYWKIKKVNLRWLFERNYCDRRGISVDVFWMAYPELLRIPGGFHWGTGQSSHMSLCSVLWRSGSQSNWRTVNRRFQKKKKTCAEGIVKVVTDHTCETLSSPSVFITNGDRRLHLNHAAKVQQTWVEFNYNICDPTPLTVTEGNSGCVMKGLCGCIPVWQ